MKMEVVMGDVSQHRRPASTRLSALQWMNGWLQVVFWALPVLNHNPTVDLAPSKPNDGSPTTLALPPLQFTSLHLHHPCHHPLNRSLCICFVRSRLLVSRMESMDIDMPKPCKPCRDSDLGITYSRTPLFPSRGLSHMSASEAVNGHNGQR